MFEKLEITSMAQSLAAHAGQRLGVIAQNVANADTPGFQAQDVQDFSEVWESSRHEAMHSTRAGHIGAGDAGLTAGVFDAPGQSSPNGNTVSVETEMVKAVETRQQHEMALAVYRGTSEVIRASLGRRG
jgi:flagellar basal-body rod protein FlgB